MNDLEKVAIRHLEDQIQKMGNEKNNILGCYEPLTYGFRQMQLNATCERFHQAWGECLKTIETLLK